MPANSAGRGREVRPNGQRSFPRTLAGVAALRTQRRVSEGIPFAAARAAGPADPAERAVYLTAKPDLLARITDQRNPRRHE